MLLPILILLPLAFSSDEDHRPGDPVTLWVNKIGPFNNPQETYSFDTLPFCRPWDQVHSSHKRHSPQDAEAAPRKRLGLGEALSGNELVDSGLQIRFAENVPVRKICGQLLDRSTVKEFRYAVLNHYWYQMYFDDLPIWGMVGDIAQGDELIDDRTRLYTHKKFVIAYNGDRVIEVNLTSENPLPIVNNVDLAFTYQVDWIVTDTSFEDRFLRYLDNNFFEHQIHWFSIFNSFMMVLFLTGLVAMILIRTLRRDFARYAREDVEEPEPELAEEAGWKMVHGDVFRPPLYLVLFSAVLGTGIQLVVLICTVVVFAIITQLYAGRGTIITTFIVCYAFTALVGGFISGGFYMRQQGRNWIRTMILTACLFPGVLFGVAFLLNLVAVAYDSLAAIPFGTVVAIILIWAFVAFPLTLGGSLAGRNLIGASTPPCRILQVPRPIPHKPWWLEPIVIIFAGGILPFGSIFIEMYFIFTSFWNYKFYYVYGFMLLVLLILTVVTMCSSIVGTYFLLNAEDYRWPWTAFLASAGTAGYLFLYVCYFFVMKTHMSGFMQTSFYFGYMSLFCFALGIMCGAIGYYGSEAFVYRIYRGVKID